MADAPLRECPSCALEGPSDATECPYCGYEFPPERKTSRAAAVAFVLLMLWPLFEGIRWLLRQ